MITIVGQEKKFRATCESCGSLLEYVYTDTHIHKYAVRRLGKIAYGAYRSIICPVCNNQVRHEGTKQ